MNDKMNYCCEHTYEPLILEPEDYPGEEWTTILKIFGMKDAERIVVSDYKLEAYGIPKDDHFLNGVYNATEEIQNGTLDN